MQNRFLDAVDVETLRHHLNLATKLSSSFTADDKRELIKLAQDPTLPNKYAQSENVEYAKAYSGYYDILRTGSLATASEQEQHMAKIFYAALALQLLPKNVHEELIENVIFDRTQIELNLHSMSLNSEDAICLSHILPLTTITTLNVRVNKIGGDGAKALATNQALTTLDLGNNEIGSTGAETLAKNQTLTTLDVSDNDIGDDGAKALAANQTLKMLDVSSNNIGVPGARAFAANQTLATLYLDSNQIGAVGAAALAANQTLTTLYLRSNGIGAAGAAALAANQTLTTLDVSINRILDDGAKALATNQTLTTLYLGSNQIGNDGAKALAANQTLTSLYVGGNNIRDDGAKALAANQTLINLDISYNRIGDDGKKALAEDNPVTRYHTGKSVGVDTPFPSLTRQAMFVANKNADTQLPSGKTLQEEADEKLPEEIKEVLKKPKI